MADEVESLEDAQAIRAVKLFYDLTPPEVWADGNKPSPERVRTIGVTLLRGAQDDVKPALAALLEDQPGNTPARAAVCRLILREIKQSAVLCSYATRAIEAARKPDMAIDPITGAFIVSLLLATTKIEKTTDGWKVYFGGTVADVLRAIQIPESLQAIGDVLKALPKEVLDQVWKKTPGG